MLLALESQVLEVYRFVDAAVAGFAERSRLSCPQGCGHCCLSDRVEATILECIPLAFLLFRTAQAEPMLQRLEENGDGKRCVLYSPDRTRDGFWGCTQYQMRPVVCRLFGFAGNHGRDGKAGLVMCRVMKAASGAGRADIVTGDASTPMPFFADAGLHITTLHPGLGTVRLPVNAALRQAIMKVGVALDLQAES